MNQKDLLLLNNMIKGFKDLPSQPGWPNMYTRGNITYSLVEYHRICSKFYQYLLNYAKPNFAQVENKINDLCDERYFMFRVVDIIPQNTSITYNKTDGTVTVSQDREDYIVLEEILLYHEDEKKFREANKSILRGEQL